ncbi:hypothetical protein NQ318_008050 [Aromia moschata]|uniref:Tc1-like transposase DDE domain-containing protein n=1 Tax=Aromia moschata TaxID=1265417 RepID=A0AAV8X3V7_9CUCU|nr:hypothetical protein NQ318_008050 [Aromia moschata]
MMAYYVRVKKTGDYHEDMNADLYEKWFSSILRKLESGSVVVMDNAPYHSRRLEALPRTAWRTSQIVDWLKNKNIPFDDNQLKIQLLEIAKLHNEIYVKYAVDETAAVE